MLEKPVKAKVLMSKELASVPVRMDRALQFKTQQVLANFSAAAKLGPCDSLCHISSMERYA